VPQDPNAQSREVHINVSVVLIESTQSPNCTHDSDEKTCERQATKKNSQGVQLELDPEVCETTVALQRIMVQNSQIPDKVEGKATISEERHSEPKAFNCGEFQNQKKLVIVIICISSIRKRLHTYARFGR